MPTLNWIGKDAVVTHHYHVSFHLLKDVPDLGCGDPGSGNLIVQGDNLLALKALLPYFAGQVKCIYIDPPYNTGNEGWVYNDNVNNPVIREWLGKVVGSDSEDLSRHDKWLSMMYPRLALLKRFLRDDGVIFVSIDDNEVAALRLLLDEIFGSNNFVAHFVWEKRKNRENRKTVSVRHDHVLSYSRDASQALSRFHLLPMDTEALARYKNSDNDNRGPWKSDPATAQAGHGTKSQFYVLKAPNGKLHELPSGRCWVYTEDVMNKAISDGRIWFGQSGNNVPRIKTFLQEKERGLTPETILFAEDASTNEEAKNELKELFDGRALFETPKPVELILQFLRMCTRKGDLVLDSFAGSGTTGHAVLRQNAEDGGDRRFILIEMEPKIARDVTTKRIQRVAEGYKSVDGKAIPGLGGGFRFCELGDPLFDESGKIRKTVTFADLARHVYFTETGEPLPRERVTKSPFIGECRGLGIYLLYNGILGDKSAHGGNVLTRQVLARLPKFGGQKVVYCAGNLLGRDRLRAERIVVRQTPYEVKVS